MRAENLLVVGNGGDFKRGEEVVVKDEEGNPVGGCSEDGGKSGRSVEGELRSGKAAGGWEATKMG